MQLYLMRHGDAKKNEPGVLSKRGKKESKRIAESLSKPLGNPLMEISKILCSGEIRAKETAEIVSKKLNVPVEETEGLNPEHDVHLLLDMINEKNGNIMLVGHLPNLSKLASLLLLGEERDLLGKERALFDFKKSSVACLESCDDGWILKFFITPEIL
jgi:phosphohistidine phosphatase